jgi:hypothetical protein
MVFNTKNKTIKCLYRLKGTCLAVSQFLYFYHHVQYLYRYHYTLHSVFPFLYGIRTVLTLKCGPLSHTLCHPGCGHWQQSAAKRDWEWRTPRPGRTYLSNLGLDYDRSSGNKHFTDFSSTFRDLVRIFETFSESVFFSRKIRRRINGSKWKAFCGNSCCNCRREILLICTVIFLLWLAFPSLFKKCVRTKWETSISGTNMNSSLGCRIHNFCKLLLCCYEGVSFYFNINFVPSWPLTWIWLVFCNFFRLVFRRSLRLVPEEFQKPVPAEACRKPALARRAGIWFTSQGRERNPPPSPPPSAR